MLEAIFGAAWLRVFHTTATTMRRMPWYVLATPILPFRWSLSPGPLVGLHHQVYPCVGADIVMESITLIDPRVTFHHGPTLAEVVGVIALFTTPIYTFAMPTASV